MWVRAILLAACLFATLCWIRFLLQAAKLPHSHPLLRLCRRATDFLVEPLRRVVPPLHRWDGACLLAAAAVDYAACTALLWLNNETLFAGGKGFAAAWLFAVLAFSEAAAYALLCCLLLHALRQTENDALADSLNRICRPICHPFSGLHLPRKLSALPPSVLLWLWLTQALPALTGRLNLWLIW